MENPQINEARDAYEAGLEDSQPVEAMSDYEAVDKIGCDQWVLDCADASFPDRNSALYALAYLRGALSDEQTRHIFAQDLGNLIINNAVAYANRCIAAEETGGVR